MKESDQVWKTQIVTLYLFCLMVGVLFVSIAANHVHSLLALGGCALVIGAALGGLLYCSTKVAQSFRA